jgi:hypothetical protein
MKNFNTLHKSIFYFFVLALPLNLGKHFVFRWSYARGILIDYLVPTVYFQDFLIILLLLTWFVESHPRFIKTSLAHYPWIFRFLILFLTSVFISTVFSVRVVASLYFVVRLVLGILLFVYVSHNFILSVDFPVIARILCISVFFLGVLGVIQWNKQGSLFDNYLFFGEQPYSSSVRGVAVENILGVAKIPAYGVFRHPNVFGGFLSIVLIWIFSLRRKNSFVYLSLLFGVGALFYTFSQVAWLFLILGLAFLYLYRRFGNLGIRLSLLVTLLLSLIFLCIPLICRIDNLCRMPSLSIRSLLEVGAFKALSGNVPFGTGPSTASLVIEVLVPQLRPIRFPQPVHNIFLLIFLESGVFALFFFVLIFGFVLTSLFKRRPVYWEFLFITLLQMLILGGFDHYLYTIHQTVFLFWLTLGMALAYTYPDEV